MRFDKEIYFVTETTAYNYDTGNYDDLHVTKVKRFANITNQSEQRMAIAYGNIEQDSLTIRLQNTYSEPFDYIEYNGKKYRVTSQRTVERRHILQVSAL